MVYTFELTYWCSNIRSSAFCCLKASVSVIKPALEPRVSLLIEETEKWFNLHIETN